MNKGARTRKSRVTTGIKKQKRVDIAAGKDAREEEDKPPPEKTN